ncbi:hypothetical protein [Micromonospora pattaloongensis]|nr:hypothetical protein [Micromonospora pattaloongensis]
MQRSTTDGAASTSAPTGDAGPPAGAPTHRRDEPPAWLGLPAIQRVTPDEPRLNLPESFTGSLAAWRDPSYLSPLGHLVGDGEPAGVLHGAVLPVPEPAPADPGTAGGTPADTLTSLPLVTPPPEARRTAPSLQRQIGGASAGPPPAVSPGERPVPVERGTVSRLLTAPPAPLELHLPAVDRPADRVQRTVDSAAPDPTGAPGVPETPEKPGAPTLGLDAQVAGPATFPVEPGASRGADAPTGPEPAAGTAGPIASPEARRSAPDLPVQRSAGNGPGRPRRLGLGEPIVPPPRPPSPAASDAGAAGGLPVQRRSIGDGGPSPAHRPPRGVGEAVAGPRPFGPPDGGDGSPDTAPTAAETSAGLIGEAVVSRLGASADPSATALDPSPADTPADAGAVRGPAPPVGELPVTGAAAGRTSHADATPSDGGAAGSGTDGPPPVQTFVPPEDGALTDLRMAPLLAEPPTTVGGSPPPSADVPTATTAEVPTATTAGGRAAGRADGRGPGTSDLPVVSRLAAPGTSTEPDRTGGSTAGTTSDPTGGTGGPLVAPDHAPLPPAEAGPATADLVGGYPNAPDATGDAADGGPPDATSAPAPPPLVVSRLVGERPVRLLTGAVPDVPAPPRPSVQRVTWQHDETAATPVSGPPRPEPGHLVEPEVPLPSAAAPEGTGTFTVAGSPGAAGPVPVQRWVGALPDSSPPAVPGRSRSGGDSPPSAYPGWPDPVAQRAEPADAPPAEVRTPSPAAEPPPGGGPTATGQPAAGTAPAAGVEPEELLKKLYDPLLRRLKTELRLDRERHGVLGGPG